MSARRAEQWVAYALRPARVIEKVVLAPRP